jgi:uncharacterized protein (TIGR03437 family)
MLRKFLLTTVGIVAAVAGAAQTATFGIRVPIGGEATDLALDEPRGVLYIANFTASRIDRMNLATFQLMTPIPVDPNPGSMSLSPNRLWLVVAHFDNPTTGTPTNNHLTLIDLLHGNSQRTYALPDPVLAVSFGSDNQAFVVTSTQFLLYNPVSNSATVLDTVANIEAKTTPAPDATFPLDVTTTSVSRSGDGMSILGVGGSTSTITFRYDVASQTVSPGEITLATGNLGPRVVSLNHDGSLAMVGWIELARGIGITNFIPQSSNQFSVGTSLFDDSRGLIYAQIPPKANAPPILQILAQDNLTVLQQLTLPENTTGKSALSSDSSVMYSISASGVLVLPVGFLNSYPLLTTSARSLLLQGNFCSSGAISQTLTVTNPGGVATAFSFRPASPGITVSPSSGVTPATVTVTVDPSAFSGLNGTQAVDLGLSSSNAVNVINPVTALFNHAQPNQRGTILQVPGTLVDILADPVRDQYYVLRQDNNTVLVFDGANNALLQTLRTNNVPTTLAISYDNQFLYIGHDASLTLAVYSLADFSRLPDVATGAGNGNVVRSLAVTNNKIIATSRDYKGIGHILLFDPVTLTGSQPAAVGEWINTISTKAVATATADGSQAMVATPDGFTFLYDASVGDFTVSRQDFTSLTGSYAAMRGLFTADVHVLDGSLVPLVDMDSSLGPPSGFVFIPGGGVRTGAVNSAGPGFVEYVNFSTGAAIAPTPTVEAPLLPDPTGDMGPFIRSLAVLPFHGSYVSLSDSGLTLLPANFYAAPPPPAMSSVASAADGTSGVASGGLISIFGSNLSAATITASTAPLPTILGNTCAVVNGKPISLLVVSPSVINAQLDDQTSGPSTITILTTQNVSPVFNFTVGGTAPAVFLNGVSGTSTNLPAIVRASNGLAVTPSNPIHRGDSLTIFAAGLGLTSPLVAAGSVTPSKPPAVAVVQPSVTLNGVGLPVIFAGLEPGQIGVYEIQVTVPANTPVGLSVPLIITQSGVSQTANVRVVN